MMSLVPFPSLGIFFVYPPLPPNPDGFFVVPQRTQDNSQSSGHDCVESFVIVWKEEVTVALDLNVLLWKIYANRS